MTNYTIEELIIKLKLDVKGLNKGAKKSKDAMLKQSKAVSNTRAQIKQLEESIKPVKKAFDAGALGIMFFGMAIQRTFNRMTNVGVSAFQDVMHSVAGTVTVFDRLKTSLEVIKFELGSAISSVIEPFIPMLITIGDKMANWISANDKAVGSFTLLGGAVGGLLFLFGTLKLGLAALGITISGFWLAISVGFIAQVAIWKSTFNDFKQPFIDGFNNIKNSVVNTFTDLWKNVKNTFNNFKDFVKNVFSGDFDKAWDSLLLTFESFRDTVKELWADLGLFLVNTMRSAWNFVVQSASNQAAKTLGIFRSIFKGLNMDGMVSSVDKALSIIDSNKALLTFDMVTKDNFSSQINDIQENPIYQPAKGAPVTINVYNPTGSEVVQEIRRSVNPTSNTTI